jgi:hypothetical protein
MAVNNVLLFISSVSQSCVQPVTYIRERNLPIMVVRLDTVEDRRKAANGPFFKITEVPTMVVSYSDNTVQLFVGSGKILEWMNSINKKEEKVMELDTPVENVSKKKKKKKKMVSFEDEDIELLENAPPPKREAPANSSSNSKNSNIFNIAKKMEQDRLSTIGYKEEDLPKY